MSDVRRATRDPRVVQEQANGRPGESNLDELVIISGLSGAGKSSALNVFEDAGYFCVDNLPAEMIRSLADLFMHEGSKVERAAVVSDSRGANSATTSRLIRSRFYPPFRWEKSSRTQTQLAGSTNGQ
jgi:hypothetical protein